MTAFTELGLMPELSGALEKMDWLLPTEIQAEAIPLILGGGDVLMASETGTGKTGAFCIPITQVVYEQMLESKKQPAAGAREQQSKKLVDTGWLLSTVDRAPDVVLSRDLLTAQSKSGNWQGCRANKGFKRSKNQQKENRCYYYEVHFAEQGLARVGWSFGNASLDLGTDRAGYGYGGTAKKSNNRQFSDYGLAFGEKFDIVGCILDLNSGDMSFTKNGRNMGVAFKIPPKLLEANEIYPTICVKNAGCRVQFGSTTNVNDYKPDFCTWTSEANSCIVVSKTNLSKWRGIDSGPLAIILEPSRELAKQTYDCLQTFSQGLEIKTVLWVGGDGSKTIEDKIHIIVCTPGRLSEAVSKQQVSLDNVHFFILDEADGLLQQGHQNLLRSVHSQLPKMFETGRRLQTICCSATLHNFEVKKLAQQLMYFPTWIDLKGEDSVPDTVHHVVLRIDPKKNNTFRDLENLFQTDGVHERDNVYATLYNPSARLTRDEEYSEAIKLMKFYYTVKAIESLNMDQGIIFCRTKLDCDNLDQFMQDMNRQTNSSRFSCVRLHSSLSQRERFENLENFKEKKVKFLICTDVAARGIDIKEIPFVIQVTLPDDKANYIHRIGRVGRAERMGLAVSLVGTQQEKVWFHKCNKRECHNTRLIEKGGCCKWFDELTMLADIEEHLKCSIQEIEPDFKLQVNEYDGKVVYGAKRLEQATTYEGHVEQLKSIVNSLSDLESKAQLNYLKLYG